MTAKQPDYQKLHDELEDILEKLQSGALSIDEAMPAYERGLTVVKELESFLETAQNRVAELQAKLQD
jgi:exodeoxyribonuclease VII small subunit